MTWKLNEATTHASLPSSSGPRSLLELLSPLQLKQDFMCSVFNKCLLSDMGKTLVRKHLDTMNDQPVQREFEAHMTTSSKGKAEKYRLDHCDTTTVPDRSWNAATDQFVLHFNEQFRQQDEVSPSTEVLPQMTRLTLLQTAVHAIPELKVVEAMEEFLSSYSSTRTTTLLLMY